MGLESIALNKVSQARGRRQETLRGEGRAEQ